MNIKSLLLGSAAALVAVTGARAADAVVIAEPEPMDYVRVCDTYGAGFYYIPGTETCLRVGGYMQYDIGVGELLGRFSADKKEFFDGRGDPLVDDETYFKRARFQLEMDARSETELGTLRAYMAIRFNYSTTQEEFITSTGNAFTIDQGYIELGGFRVGATDSLFTTFTGYAGAVINDTFPGIGYGPFTTNQIAYTFTGGNGFSAAVALEEGDGPVYTLDDYTPHVVGGLSFTQAWGGISGVVGYDAVYEEWAGKVRLDVNATEQLSLFIMGGYKSGAGDNYGPFDEDRPNFYGQWSGDWVVFGGGTFTVNEKASINVQLGYTEHEDFSAVANVAYELVPGLRITPEVAYVDYGDEQGMFGVDESSGDTWNGWLRFRRSF